MPSKFQSMSSSQADSSMYLIYKYAGMAFPHRRQDQKKRAGNCFTYHLINMQVINKEWQINIPPETCFMILPCHSITMVTRQVRGGVCQKEHPVHASMLNFYPLARNSNGGLPLHFAAISHSLEVVSGGKVQALHHRTSTMTMKSCPPKNDAKSG